MAKRKASLFFERPRDEDGHFLPMEMWTQKEIREFERAKREGMLKNPLSRKDMKGKKSKGRVWYPPQDEQGRYLPESEWTASERRLYEQAKKKGLTPAAQQIRDEKGRFVSKDGKSRKKAKRVREADYPTRSGAETGVQVNRLDGGGVTVIYPPYPPHPSYPPYYQRPSYIAPVQGPDASVQQFPLFEQGAGALPGNKSKEEDKRHVLKGDKEARLEQGGRTKGTVGGVYSPSYSDIGIICDTCQEKILEEQRNLHDEFQLIKKKFVSLDPNEEQILLDVIKNPRKRHAMYHVKRTFSDKVTDGLSALGKRPLLALVAVGAVVAIGYALFRAFRAIQMRALSSVGVEIVNGVMYFPGENPYVITDADKLWLARSIWGEVSREPAAWSRPDVKRGGAAVLWSLGNHFMTVGSKRSIYRTLGDFAQGYCQPINPRWIDPNGEKCRQSPQMCTADRIAFRRALRARSWGEFPVELQNLVISFINGRLPNPVGSRTDWRASNTGYRPSDILIVSGNVFGTAPNARRRPTEQVA